MFKPSSLAALAVLALSLSACGRPETPAAAPQGTAAVTPSAPDNAAAAATDPATGAAPSDTGAAPTETGTSSASWTCGDRAVTTEFDNASDSVHLTLGGRTLVLAATEAASGSRYSDAQGNEFWEHQGEATLTEAGGQALKCTRGGSATTG